MPSTIPDFPAVVNLITSSDDEDLLLPPPRVLVIPRVVFNSKSTRALRRAIRRQQREAEYRAERRRKKAEAAKLLEKKRAEAAKRMEKKKKQHQTVLSKLHCTLNCNRTRNARPKKGSMKDRDNSEQTGGEDEDCFVQSPLPRKPVSEKEAAQMLLKLGVWD